MPGVWLIAVMAVNIVATNILLNVFLLSGAFALCPVWSNLFITAPLKMEALRGSCLQIPCNFSARYREEFEKGKMFGLWIRGNQEKAINGKYVVHNSSGIVNTYPMTITGNLHEKNCTTVFSNMMTIFADTYYFRVEKWPFRETALCDPLQITVQDSPRSPRIEISGVLKEKESVTVTCSALTPCPHSPPQLTWNLQQHAHTNMEENTDGTFTTKIQETITLSDKHDGNIITCSAKYPVNEGKGVKTAEETKTLRVSYAPKDTSVSISPSGLVSAGEQVNLTCSSRANPPVSRFIWFKISKDGATVVSVGEVYSFTVTDGGVYYCVALSKFGTDQSSESRLTVKGQGLFDTAVTNGGVTFVTGTPTASTIQLQTFNATGHPKISVYFTVKILGIIMLYSTIIIFECGLRSRCRGKQVKMKEAIEMDNLNKVIEEEEKPSCSP